MKSIKQGFTLIELLAVIIILAVIALIITPIIQNIINNAKSAADLRSAEAYVDAANNFYTTTLLNSDNAALIGTDVFDKIEVSGAKASSGIIKIDNSGSVYMAIVLNNKCYTKNYTDTVENIAVSTDTSSCGASNGTYQMLAYVDDTLTSTMPAEDTGYTVDKITCTNGAIGTWNYSDWALYIKNNTSSTVCSVYFNETKTYVDDSGASYPELYQGLIPVVISSTGGITVADTSQNWYDYKTHNWANAVLVNASDSSIKDKYFTSDMKIKQSVVGQTIDMSDILQMYVWIPRYRYLLWNAANGSSNPQAISIVFESAETAKSTGSTNGTYLTHPAFTFGTTELNGIWVGKFETSGTATNVQIKPNQQSLINITVGDMFNASRNIELNYASNYGIDATSIDTHMMKNEEWGAVAYLSSSIYGRYNDTSTCISSGCETWINNVNTLASGSNGSSITGCSGSSVSAAVANSMSACASGYDWTTLGVNASTNGNITGIYDMSGGAWEYVMGDMADSSGNYYPSSSGLTKPDIKYFDSYAYSASSYTDHNRGKLGDATKETLKTYGSATGGWYGDYAYLPNASYSWFTRGGHYDNGTGAGVFNFNRGAGGTPTDASFRSVITTQ